MPSTKKAFVTGCSGQDGSYLAELLLQKGYEVHGLVRWAASNNVGKIQHLVDQNSIILHRGDITDAARIEAIISEVKPQEVYHLAAQSHVGVSFAQPEYTLQATGLGVVRMLEAIRKVNPGIKFYQASTSELFGNVPPPQNELSLLHPESPYGIAKLAAFHAVRLYRESYGIFAVNGILFNHESPRRGEEFVTRKITLGVSRIKAGLAKEVTLGNLDARRDWGYAPEYVDAMWRMLQLNEPEDFVIATGQTHSVREFAEEAFRIAGLDWRDYVRQDVSQLRPRDVHVLVGDSSKAKRLLGWEPRTRFHDLVKIMVDADLKLHRVVAPETPLWASTK